MGYLQPAEYEAFGLTADTSDDWVTTASTLIDSHCRRSSLNATQYVERMRLNAGSQTVRLSYLPLIAVAPATNPLVSVQARYAKPRRGPSHPSAPPSKPATPYIPRKNAKITSKPAVTNPSNSIQVDRIPL